MIPSDSQANDTQAGASEKAAEKPPEGSDRDNVAAMAQVSTDVVQSAEKESEQSSPKGLPESAIGTPNDSKEIAEAQESDSPAAGSDAGAAVEKTVAGEDLPEEVPDASLENAPDPSEEHPMLRPLEAYPVDHASMPGQKLLALYDPSGIAPSVVTLPPFGAAVIDLCDGSRTREEICAEFLARYRRPLPKESLEALLKKLDDALLLDSTNFRLHCAKIFADFGRLPVRPAHAAGLRYPVDPGALTALLEQAFAPPNGPGLPTAPVTSANGDNGPVQAAAPTSALPRALIVPTVDLSHGGPAYAWAYRPLLDVAKLPSLIVLLGCDRAAADPMVTLTRKHFSTPLGELETDIELVDALAAAAKEQSSDLEELFFRDEFHHRAEHSLEFQVLFLRYILAQRKQRGLDADPEFKEPRILPILCGSLHELAQLAPNRAPDAHQKTNLFDQFAILLQQKLGERVAKGETVLIVAAADLAHVGPRFGDPEPLSEDDRDSLERRDRETLKPVYSGDAQSFLSEIRRERDRRRIVGLGTIYLFLQTARPTGGRLRCYAQCSADVGSYISTASILYP